MGMLYWLTGLLEGEGAFLVTPAIQVKMIDEDVIARVAESWRVVYQYIPAPRHNWSDTYRVHLTGRRAAALMTQIYPLLGFRRRAQIDRALSKYSLNFGLTTPLLDFNEAPSEYRLAWLAGLLEGEGTFGHGPPSAPNRPLIRLQMTDEDIVARVASLLGVSYHQSQEATSVRRAAYATHLRGRRAIELMQELRPWMGRRRGQRIDEILLAYDWNPRRFSVANRHDLTENDVMDIYMRACAGEKYQQIADDYKDHGVTRNTVKDIRRGKSWGWLTNPGYS
jgi:hypothetical protein